jgi:hypothetical protein
MQKTTGLTVDISFVSVQRTMLDDGVFEEVGTTAFSIWIALKWHSNYHSGMAYPGVRRIAAMVDLNKDTVCHYVHVLEDAKLLRIVPRGRGYAYFPRERLDIRLDGEVVCHAIIDYKPTTLRAKLIAIEHALSSGKGFADDAFTDVEIVPKPSFVWDPEARTLRRRSVAEMQTPSDRTHHSAGMPADIRAQLKLLQAQIKTQATVRTSGYVRKGKSM